MKIKQRAVLLTGLLLILAGSFVVFSHADSAYHVKAAVGMTGETDTGNTYIKVAGMRLLCGSKKVKVTLSFRLPVRKWG